MWAVAFVLGLVNYSGASINYIVFSLVFLALLISGIKQILSYGYMYVTIFLWLGFWLKMTVHFIFKYPFVEAVGIFHGTPAEWDGVLFIASIAALGVLLANYLLRHLKIQVNMRGRVTESIVPGWYSKNRHVFKVILLIPLIAIPALNIALGIHQIGVVPEHILLWPLNAVISWLITIGLAMGVATVVWWEICLGKGVKASLMLIIIEAFSSSVSVMSRGLYLFHAIPQVVALSLLGREHLKIHWKQMVIWSGIVVILFVSSISLTSNLREQLFAEAPEHIAAESALLKNLKAYEYELLFLRQQVFKNAIIKERIIELEEYVELTSEGVKVSEMEKKKGRIGRDRKRVNFEAILLEQQGLNQTFIKISKLAIDRWVGAEGLMAVYSYPNKGASTLLAATFERREIGKIDMFQNVSRSQYRYSDVNSHQFSTLPGMVAFLFYSGSSLLVFLGMAIVIILLVSIEVILMKVSKNPILCSLLGLSFANIVAQFGVAPRQMIPYVLMIVAGVIVIAITQMKVPKLVRLDIGK